MAHSTYIVLAPARLKPGITEEMLLKASDRFEREFVKKQKGIVSRKLLRAKDGSYADLVTFESAAAAAKVMEAELTSPVCAEFFSIMAAPDPGLPDMGLLSFELVKAYE
jgi:hypothetical protein